MVRDKQIRVLIADAQAKVRSALRLVLEQQPDIQVLGEAVNGRGVIDWTRAVCPDLILLDWDLCIRPEPDLVSRLNEICSDAIVVVLSAQPEAAQAAMEAGADAFVSKGDQPERLLAVLERVHSPQAVESRP